MAAVDDVILFEAELPGLLKGEVEGAHLPLSAAGPLAVPVAVVKSKVWHNILFFGFIQIISLIFKYLFL